MRIIVKLFYLYTTIISLLLGSAYYVKWIEPLPNGQHANTSSFYVYKREYETVGEASLIIKGKVLKASEYEIIDISERLIYPNNYYPRFGTIYDICVNEVYYTDNNVVKGDVVKVYNMFSSRRWDVNCIDYNADDEYIFFFDKIVKTGKSPVENLAEYNLNLPWFSTILINSEDEYIFFKEFRSLRKRNAEKKFRPDIYKRHLQDCMDDYTSIFEQLIYKFITPEEYSQQKAQIENSMLETWARSDAFFMDDMKAMISKYKNRNTG